MKISIILAVSDNNVIGKDNKLIWSIPNDLKRFKELTTGHVVIMGRKTYESIGRPLPKRINVIITNNIEYKAEGCIVVHSLKDAIHIAKDLDAEAFIIGGSKVYEDALEFASKIYLTRVHQNFEGDAFAPYINDSIWHITEEIKIPADENNEIGYTFITLEK
jgi:dihydrofolate reductase